MPNINLHPPIVKPDYNAGTVSITTGYKSIPGYTSFNPVYQNGYVNLNSGSGGVNYSSGLLIKGDFSFQLKGKNFSSGEIIRLKSDTGETIKIFYYGKYVALQADPGYFITSNILPTTPSSNTDVYITIQRKGSLYNIKYST